MKKNLKVYSKMIEGIKFEPINVYQNYVGKEQGFLLESYSDETGRYSFIAKNPAEKITSLDNGIVIEDRMGNKVTKEGNPIKLLERYMSESNVVETTGLPFTGGLVGVIGYDFIRFSEELPEINPDELEIEPIQLWVVYNVIVFDHINNTLTVIDIQENSNEGEDIANKQIEKILQVINNIKDKFVINSKKVESKLVSTTDTMESFVEKVKSAKNYIIEGDIFQVVLSQRWCIETNEDGLKLYKDLREINPSPYLYYFHYDNFEVIGSSPEMLVKKMDKDVYTCPIAGTRKRGKTPEEDRVLADDLLADEKELAEHVMLVDLARNDMGKVSKFGTVNVSQFKKVQNYSHVMHMVSLVEGKSQDDLHPFEILSSFLPAGTLSGAPKIRAMEIIEELEEVKRGPYGGAIGYVGFNNNMDFCITIRTMIKKGNKVYLQAGAGIVADSVPEKEFEECHHKVNALSKVLLKGDERIDLIS